MDRYQRALVAQGVEYAVAQDKAFMSDDREAEAHARGALEATQRALATSMGTEVAKAAEAILMAMEA